MGQSGSPLEQAPWGGLLHLPQSLHGQDLDHVNDHTRDLKHRGDAALTSRAELKPGSHKYVSSPSVPYLIHKHFQGDGHVVDEVIHWK